MSKWIDASIGIPLKGVSVWVRTSLDEITLGRTQWNDFIIHGNDIIPCDPHMVGWYAAFPGGRRVKGEVLFWQPFVRGEYPSEL